MITLEQRIADEIVEYGDGDEHRRQEYVESVAENFTNELMDELGLKTEESLAIILPSVVKAIEKEIDWGKVDEDLEERRKDALDWFDSFDSAVQPR
jgi:uncharacterized protein YpuA (DUF1002 family)